MTLRGYGVLIIGIAAGLGSVLFASRFLLTMASFFFATLALSAIWLVTHRSKISIERAMSPEYVYENSDVLVTLLIDGATSNCSIRDYFDNGKRTSRFWLARVGKD